MHRNLEIWTRNLWIWLLPLMILGINLILLGLYQTSFASRRTSLENISGRAGLRLEGLRSHHLELERFLVQVDQQKQAINSIYTEHFSTEAERFTQLLRVVRQLSRQAGLAPDSFAYPKENLENEGLVSRKITFSVEGSYENLRRLINFLELSEQFISLDDVSLSGESGSDRLTIRLSLSTLFEATDKQKMLENALDSIEESRRIAVEQATEQTSGDAADGEASDDVNGDALEEK